MADVKIIDIDSEQWNIKDQKARDDITEVKNNSEILSDINITPVTGTTFDLGRIFNISTHNKIIQMNLQINNLVNTNLGTINYFVIGNINLIPKVRNFFVGYDNISGLSLTLQIDEQGNLLIISSKGIASGNNQIRGSFMFILS